MTLVAPKSALVAASTVYEVAPVELFHWSVGVLETVGVPFAGELRVKAPGGLASVNVAVTVWAEVSASAHVPVPEQPPPFQPVKADPFAAAAVRVTDVPVAKLAEAPQLTPAGVEVTVPVPVPALATVSTKVTTGAGHRRHRGAP